ncbi:hypothetical protein MKX01_008500 [Papaver californicum]|nr:hypothetical protein MKX01_008500 [Papaver californicum]
MGSSTLVFLVLISIDLGCRAIHEDRKMYFVYMGKLPSDTVYVPTSHHQSLVQDILQGSKNFNGFSAKLTTTEAQKSWFLQVWIDGVVTVFESKRLQLQTTRSWDFIGFPETVARFPTVESDVIIGVLDTGIWPEAESFLDEGFGPPPKKWKGVWHSEGSSAVGKNCRYKVCSPFGCDGHAILAGFDDAIADGVDIFSVSLGYTTATMFYNDPVAIGSFHAIEKDILTSHSAGNTGPSQQSVTSTAPWLFTVGASSTDRRLADLLVLGNGETFWYGYGVNAFNLNEVKFPLLDGGNGLTGCSKEQAQSCLIGCLDRELVKGKTVVWDTAAGVVEAFESGALGAIFIEGEFYNDDTIVYPLSATLFSVELGERVKSYINTTKDLVATILKTGSIIDYRAPVVSSFSSRGPNSIIPDIIKPDIAAPGVNILTAFSPLGHPSEIAGDGRSVRYSILSGTLMACPHVTGAAAYIPVLFTEHLQEDYISMLCDIGVDAEKIQVITNRSCPVESVAGNARELNYPSLGAYAADNQPFSLTFTRTVTNVGTPPSTYYATTRTDSVNINVTVMPDVLSFDSLMEIKSFVVNIVGTGLDYSETATGSLVWSDGMHSARSPVVVYAYNFEA